jgi:hypothetical protein
MERQHVKIMCFSPVGQLSLRIEDGDHRYGSLSESLAQFVLSPELMLNPL